MSSARLVAAVVMRMGASLFLASLLSLAIAVILRR
jgi:hypothetical protein